MDTSAYPFIVGALLPPVISLLKGANWTAQTKRALALGLSVVAAAVTYVIQNGGWIGWQPLVQNWGAIYGLAQVTYTGFWEGTRIEAAAEQIGSKAPVDGGV